MTVTRLVAMVALGLILSTATLSAAALCGLACLDHAEPSGCHDVPSSPKLSECCAREAPSAEADAWLPETVTVSRALAPVEAPGVEPAAAPTFALGESGGRCHAVALFTLHRALLL